MSKDLMLDIESLGTNPDAPILSLGACWFNYDKPDIEPTGKIHVHFDVEEQCKKLGRIIDPSTVKWWFQQSDNARSAVFAPNPTSFPSYFAQLSSFLNAADTVWAKGPDFDCVLLKSLVDATGHYIKWPFWKHRCVRTMVNQFPELCAHVQMEGSAHNALVDAVYQANQIRAIAGALGHGN